MSRIKQAFFSLFLITSFGFVSLLPTTLFSEHTLPVEKRVIEKEETVRNGYRYRDRRYRRPYYRRGGRYHYYPNRRYHHYPYYRVYPRYHRYYGPDPYYYPRGGVGFQVRFRL